MIRFFQFLAVALILSSCSGDKYQITGQIDGGNNIPVYLQGVEDNQLVTIDSTEIVNGQFSFEGQVDVPDLYGIQVGENNQNNENVIILFLENSKISITGDIGSVADSEVKGSKTQDIIMDFNQELEARSEMVQSIMQRYQTAAMSGELTDEMEAELIAEYEQLKGEIDAFTLDYVKKNSHSVAAAYITIQFLADAITIEEFEEVVSLFPESIHSSTFVSQAIEKVEVAKRTAIGQPYTDFTLPAPDGEMLSLSSLVGTNYLLVDFWAGWCNPCRRKNPSMVKVYDEYKNRGFEIVGVSLDNSREMWLNAIDSDGLEWPQVSDLKGWQSPTAREYGITGIPANILLDKDGNILAKNLSTGELDDMLSNLIE